MSEIYLSIYLINLLIYFIYFSNIYQKYIYQKFLFIKTITCEDFLYNMIYKYDTYDFISYISSLEKGTK